MGGMHSLECRSISDQRSEAGKNRSQ
jgi:hypothetical protein